MLNVNGCSVHDVIYAMIGKNWNISHHLSALCILVRCPAVSISWVRQHEGCSPFITISISLSSKSTHFDHFSKINLQPIVIPVGFFSTPAIAPVTIESTIRRLVTSPILRGRCHLIIRNFLLVGNSYRLRIAVICCSWNWNVRSELFSPAGWCKMGFMVKAPVLAKDPTKKYPIIAVSAGLRWLTEVLAWKSGWDFVYCLAWDSSHGLL